MKKSIFIHLCIIVLLSACLIEQAHAGAWTLPKNKVWGEYYMKWEYAKEEYNANWKRQQMTLNPAGNNGRNWGFTMEPKLEYGVTDWFTLMSSLQYKEYQYKEYGRPAAWGPFTRKNHGVTYVMVGGRCKILSKPAIVSIQGREFINVNGYGINHGDDPFYNENQPGVGWGNNTFDLRGIVSKSWVVPLSETYKLPVYASGETGYMFNNRHVPNGWVYFLEGGFWPVPGILLKSELDGYKTHDGTGSTIEQAWGIWRVGIVWEVFGGDSVLRQGNKLFNLEFDYGMYLWGKNCAAYNEFVMKVDTQF